MSVILSKPFTCPECGEETMIDVYEMIDVTLEPELYDRVREGSMFDVTCPACGVTTQVVYPTVYYDRDNKQVITLIPAESETAESEDESKSAPRETQEGKPLPAEEYTVRVVRSYNELMEKLSIFDAGLDDHAAELCKSGVVMARRKAGDNVRRECYFIPVAKEDGTLEMYVQFFEEDGKTAYVPISGELYNTAVKALQEGITEPQYIVDEAWADQVMDTLLSDEG